MESIDRRDFLKLASLVAGGAVLAGCQQTPEPAEPAAEEEMGEGAPELRSATLEFAFYAAEGFEDPTYGNLLKTYQTGLKEMFPTLDINPVQVNYQKQAMAMAAGNASDVANINVPAAWPLMYRGQFERLTPYIDADADWKEYMSHFVPSTLDAYTYDGSLWSVPNSVETTGTIYNEDLLTAAGAKLPHEYDETEWDWEAYAATAAMVTSGEGQDKVWGANISAEWQSGLGDMVISKGGNLLADDGLSAAVTTPEFVEAAQRLVDFVLVDEIAASASALSNIQLNAYSAFINQRAAFMVSGDWAFGWVRNNQLPESPFKLNFFTSPVAPGASAPKGVGHCTSFYAWSRSKYLPEAVALTKYLSSKHAQEAMSANWTNSPILSPRLDCQDPFWSLDLVPNPEAMKRAFEVAIPYPKTPLMSASLAIGHVNTALTLVTDNEDSRPLAEVLAEVEEKINADLAKGAAG